LDFSTGALNIDAVADYGAVLRGQAREEALGEKDREEWEESERRYHARRKESLTEEWRRYHAEMIARHQETLVSLIGHHRSRLEELGGE
jgi:hypothetical protein